MVDIDIVKLLNDYTEMREKGGIQKESAESRLMLEAAKEIEKLRSDLEFQIKLASDNNNSRLRYQDVAIKGRELYEITCKQIREELVGEHVCGMCKYDCDHGLDGYANECPGFEKDDCFELNVEKYNNIVYEK